MTAPTSTDATAPVGPFGRERELATLRAALELAGAGDPRVLVVAGETGVGKSTLLSAAVGGSDATVLRGCCVPLLGPDMPFGPVVQALRGVAAQLADLGHLGAWASAELHRLVAGGVDRAATDSALDDLGVPLSGAGQVRLFEAVLRLLGDLGAGTAGGPLALVLEDIHWADRSTLDLLAFLARNLTTERLLIALTVRTDGLERGDPITTWLAELDRLPGCATVRLDRLDREATAQQVAALLGSPPDDVLLDLVHDRAAGNPLFTEQLLPWTADPARPLPTTLHDLLGARFADLPQPTRRVLEVASVLGRAVGLDLLAAVVGQPEEDVEEALVPAVDRQLVEPGPGTGYSFRHPLFREVLAAELLPGNRRRLHARAARALSEARPDDGAPGFTRMAEVARHWESAAEPRRAFSAAVLAGLAANDVWAYREADQLLGRAVRLWRGSAAPLPDVVFAELPVDGVGLLAQAAQAAHLVGDDERAVALAEEAAASCPDPARRAQVLERLGAYCFDSGRAAQAEAAYREALELLPGEEATPTRARVYAGRAMLAIGWSRLTDARAWCAEALRLARAAGERVAEGKALNALGVVTAFDGDVDTGVAHLRRSVQLAEQMSEPDDLAVASINLSYVLSVVGRFDEAVEVCRAGLATLERVGGAGLKADFLRANAADALLASGRWDEVDALLAESPHDPRGMLDFPILHVRARLDIGRGELSAAARLVDVLRSLLEHHEAPDAWQRELAETRAELALWQHRPQEAVRITEAALEALGAGDEGRFAGRLTWLHARALADVAEQAAAWGNHAELDQLRALGRQLHPAGTDEGAEAAGAPAVGALAPAPPDDGRSASSQSGHARQATSAPDDATSAAVTTDSSSAPGSRPGLPIWPEGAALAATTRAELERLAGRPAARAWAEAVRRWEVLGPGLALGYARWRAAEALVADRGSFERVVRSVRTAASTAAALRAGVLAEEVEQLARVARVDVPIPLVPGRGKPDAPPAVATGAVGSGSVRDTTASGTPGTIGEGRAARTAAAAGSPADRSPSRSPGPGAVPAQGGARGTWGPRGPTTGPPLTAGREGLAGRPGPGSAAGPTARGGSGAPAGMAGRSGAGAPAGTAGGSGAGTPAGGAGRAGAGPPGRPRGRSRADQVPGPAGEEAGAAQPGVALTPREREVLAGLVAGRTNGEIARALFISVKTASVHVSNILRKLDVPTREQAARLGYRLGVAPADDGEEGPG